MFKTKWMKITMYMHFHKCPSMCACAICYNIPGSSTGLVNFPWLLWSWQKSLLSTNLEGSQPNNRTKLKKLFQNGQLHTKPRKQLTEYGYNTKSSYIRVPGWEEDGEFGEEINLLISQGNQYTSSSLPQFTVQHRVQDGVIALHILRFKDIHVPMHENSVNVS